MVSELITHSPHRAVFASTKSQICPSAEKWRRRAEFLFAFGRSADFKPPVWTTEAPVLVLASGVADDEPAAAQGAFEEEYGVPEVGVPGVGDAVEVDVFQVLILRPYCRVTFNDFAGHANVGGDVGADVGVGGGEGDDVAPAAGV